MPFSGLPTNMWARWKPVLLFAGCALLIVVSSLLSQRIWRENGLRSLQAVNEQRVQLVANAVKAEINRQDHLPVVLALDSDVRRVLSSGSGASRLELSKKLQRLSREADTRALYVLGTDGVVLASDDWGAPDTLIGRNYADRPYFSKAVAEGRGSYLGVEPGSDRVRYYIAERVDNPNFVGVAVVRIEFDLLEAAWDRAAEGVLITDADGIVFLSSDPAFRFRRLSIPGATPRSSGGPAVNAHYPAARPDPVDVTVLERHGVSSVIRVRAENGDAVYSHQSLVLPEYGWTIHRLGDMTTIEQDQRDGAIIGGAISALLISLLLYVLQRHRAYLAAREAGARLKAEVADRTRDLREANASLQTEIEERRRTEARLRSTQNELVQASKLAALGQMSAAIAHEINQPLAAIRTFMASTRIFAQRGDNAQVAKNLDQINDLAERMASITAHLKTFARKSEPGRPEAASVDGAIAGALFLIDGQVRAARVRIEKDIEPGVLVRGYAVQLEQVMLNLIGNALDAVAGVQVPWIRIQVRSSEETVSIQISDNGPGFKPDEIDRIFDPFFTTKPIGRGLGLGLSISYGIVQDFGGQIHAANRPEGGAELTVELPVLKRGATPVARTVHA